MTNTPQIIALDFDGVICDGLIEYFQTAWRTYCQIWSPNELTPPADLANKFYRLRPVIETGWEMPILIKALLLDIPETNILQNWIEINQQILTQTRMSASDIGTKLDQIRDQWIANDEKGWLSLHRFYPGVIEKLRLIVASPVKLIIISTKEGRFINQLLLQEGIQLPLADIIGKESKQAKYKILRELIATASNLPINLWFVEDRLKTLQIVAQQADLEPVKLYLADWGYNTQAEREAAIQDPRIKLLPLTTFIKDFSTWN